MKRYRKDSLGFKRTVKALLGGLFVAMFASCDDFLTIYPTNSVVFENYWQEKGDVEAMVNSCYRTMVQTGFMDRLLVWGEIRSDNVTEGNTSIGGDLRDVNEVNLVSTNGYCSWTEFYKVINNCNIVIENAELVKKKDPTYTVRDLQVTLGEMYALRALCHFYLVRTFGAIPVMTQAVTDDSQDLYPKQVKPLVALDCIIADLKMAEGMVMASGAYLNYAQNKGRITADAVRAILADALLWRAAFTDFVDPGNFLKDPADTVSAGSSDEYYNECIAYCDRIIKDRNQYMTKYTTGDNTQYKNMLIAGYPLVRSYRTTGLPNSGDLAYNEVFGDGGMNSVPESIFELQMTGNEDENQNKLVPSFYGIQGANAKFAAGLNLLKLYELSDYRRESFIVESVDEDDPDLIAKYTTKNASGEFTADGETPMTPNYREAKNNSYLQNTNWIIYRMSDVMLMKAEAHAYLAKSKG